MLMYALTISTFLFLLISVITSFLFHYVSNVNLKFLMYCVSQSSACVAIISFIVWCAVHVFITVG